MSDLVQRLRDGVEIGEIDLADIMDAADEIQRLRLTEDECAAVKVVHDHYQGLCAQYGTNDGDDAVMAAIRSVLEKHAPQPAENRP